MKKFFTFTTLVFLCTLLSSIVFAQSAISSGLATNVPLSETANNGDIVSLTNNTYTLSNTAYDTGVIGIIDTNPAVYIDLKYTDTVGKTIYPVIKTGTVPVNVSLINGPIKRGDPITSSTIKGVGMKADKSGFILGTSLEDYGSAKSNDQKLLNVALDMRAISRIDSSNGSIFDIFNISAEAASQQPFQVFKYFLSALIAIGSIIIGILSFGRIARTGVEALGRNPLASRRIQLGIAFNSVICIVIILAGLGLSILILRL